MIPSRNESTTIGAIALPEAKARWSLLHLGNLNRGQYNDMTIGMNWYWTDRIRVMFDWIHPVTSSQTLYGDTESNLLAMRFDFNW